MNLKNLAHWGVLAPVYITIVAIVLHFGYFFAIDAKLLNVMTVGDATDGVGRFVYLYISSAFILLIFGLISQSFLRAIVGSNREKDGLPLNPLHSNFADTKNSNDSRYQPSILSKFTKVTFRLVIAWIVIHGLLGLITLPFQFALGISVTNLSLSFVMFMVVSFLFNVLILISIFFVITLAYAIGVIKKSSSKALVEYAFNPLIYYWIFGLTVSLHITFGASVGYRDFEASLANKEICAVIIENNSEIPSECVIKVGSRGIMVISDDTEKGAIVLFFPDGGQKPIKFDVPDAIPEKWSDVERLRPLYKFLNTIYRWSPVGLLANLFS